MKKEEVLNMPAGREMDALIAEKLFGWRWVVGILAFDQPCLISPELYESQKDHVQDTDRYKTGGTFPKYSTDIAAAWEVVEKFENRCMLNNVHGIWECYLPDGATGKAETASLAICRAALAAKL